MSKIDLILAIPLLWGAIIGFKKGFILEFASFVALIIGIYGAVKFSGFTAKQLSNHVEISSNYMGLISLLLTFIAIVFGVFILAKILDKALKLAALGLINRILGLIFGLLKYALILSFLLYLFENINRKFEFIDPNYKANSILHGPIEIISKPFSKLLTEFELPEFDLEDDTEILNEV